MMRTFGNSGESVASNILKSWGSLVKDGAPYSAIGLCELRLISNVIGLEVNYSFLPILAVYLDALIGNMEPVFI